MNVLQKIIISVLSITVALCIIIGVLYCYQKKVTAPLHPADVKVGTLPEKQPLIEEGYVQLSEVNMHYLKYGSGEQSVLLVHGNGGSAESLVSIAELMANEYTVYCIAERCQGKSSDPGVITYELMAKDVSEFIANKGLIKPYVIGHSDGGMVAIALAANYPDVPGAIVSFGANSNPSTFKFYFTAGVWMNNLFHKNKLNDLMLKEPDFTKEYLSRITAPTYIVAGEKDIMHASDVQYLSENIPGSKCTVVKNADHSGYVCDGRGYTLSKNFLDSLREE